MADQLIDLSKNGSISTNSDRAYASLGYGVELGATFCNGIDLKFELEASANAGLSANLTDYFQALIDIQAGVEAGFRIAAQLSPKILDETGLTASVRAYLKAYIRARLELQLTLGKIIQNVSGKTSSAELKIFQAFLDQIEIGVGVEANVQIAFTASAEIICTGRLIDSADKKAGFDFRTNAEAAFMFGAGVDFFSMARFNNITQFLRTTKNILLEEIYKKVEAKQLLSKGKQDVLFMLWNTALNTIIDASTSEQKLKSALFYDTISRFLLDFTFDQINKIYKSFVDEQTQELLSWLDTNEAAYRDDISKIIVWLDSLDRNWDNITSIFDLLPHLTLLIQAVEKTGYNKIAILKEIVAHLYHLGYLIDKDNRPSWENIPPMVQDRFSEVVGRRITRINGEADVFEYLEKSCIAAFLTFESNQTVNLIKIHINRLHNQGISVSRLLQLTLSLRDENSKKELIKIGIDTLEHLINEEVIPLLTNVLKRELEQQNDLGKELIDAVLENLVHSYTSIFTHMFRKVFAEDGSKQDFDNLSILANKFLLNLIGKNASLLVNELLYYSTQSITDAISQCEQKIRGGSLNKMADNLQQKVQDHTNRITPFELPNNLESATINKMVQATNEFILEILGIARSAMGRDTWTESRIDQISSGIEYAIFNPDSNHLNFQNLTEDQINSKIADIYKCSFLPDISLQKIRDLLSTLQTIGLKQLKAFFLDIPLALAKYLLKILKIVFIDFIIEILDVLWEKIKDLLNKLAELINELKEMIEELAEKIIGLLEDIANGVAKLFNKVAEAIDKFFDKLVALLDLGNLNWIENFLDSVWDLLGGDSQEDKAKKVLNRLRNNTKNNLNNSSFKQALEQASKNNNVDGIFVRNFINTHIIDDAIHRELNKISFRTTNAVNSAWGDASRDLHETITELERNGLSYWSTNQIKNIRENELAVSELKLVRLQRQANHLNEVNPDEIKLNSPLTIDINNHDTPIYGRYLYLDVDFGRLDIRSILNNQLALDPEKLVDPDGYLSLFEWEREVRRLSDLDNVPPLQIKILLNGSEVDLSTCSISGNRLYGHIPTSKLIHGENDLFLLVITPSMFSNKMVQKHVRFFCDHINKTRPSNSVYIDLVDSVIDSKGDDHNDAQRSEIEDREMVVITNNSPEEISMTGWKLSDAAGHEFIFEDKIWIKPGKQCKIVVGEDTLGALNWKELYNGRLIAILNNRGEFLKLTDATGKVVSHVYTGNPETNKHINLISFN